LQTIFYRCSERRRFGGWKRGVVITDPFSNEPGLPTNFDPSATASLGYAAKGSKPAFRSYAYIADAHDPQRLDIPNAPSTPNNSHAYGPGETGYVAALRAYDQAFGKFFARLKADGIDKTNTLFVVPDQNDHFVGGPPSPSNCDGVATPCTGETDLSIDKIPLTERMNSTPFLVRSDATPDLVFHATDLSSGAGTVLKDQDRWPLPVRLKYFRLTGTRA
jgi:hypothetical protein